MRALVLGSSGFIGSHLVDAIRAEGLRVRAFDRAPMRQGPCHGDVEYVYGEFSESSKVAEALQDVDIVFHSISSSVPSTSNLDPVADMETNLVPTVKLLEQMVLLGVRRLVYLSSGGTVYGNPEMEPVPETHPLRPICSYGVVKVAIENYLHMFRELYGLRPIVLRPSNPYGPRQGHLGVQGVISTFLRALRVGDPIRIWGDGGVVRDFIYIDDLIALCIRSAISDQVGVYNAGSGRGASLNELIDVIESVTGLAATVNYEPGRKFDVQHITLNSTLARDTFTWKPEIPIEEGIRRHWQWLQAAPD